MTFNISPNAPVSETKSHNSLIVIWTLPECDVCLPLTCIFLDNVLVDTFCTWACLFLCGVLYCKVACFLIYEHKCCLYSPTQLSICIYVLSLWVYLSHCGLRSLQPVNHHVPCWVGWDVVVLKPSGFDTATYEVHFIWWHLWLLAVSFHTFRNKVNITCLVLILETKYWVAQAKDYSKYKSFHKIHSFTVR